MTLLADPATIRAAALTAAARIHAHSYDTAAGVLGTIGARRLILNTADEFRSWIAGPTVFRLIPGTVTEQSTGAPTGTPTNDGGSMQIHDNEQFTLSVQATDSKGVAVADTLTWEVDDENVATVVVSDDTMSATVVAGLPGSTVITVSDGNLTATEAVDVVPGGVALLTVTEGPVEVQP